MKKIFAALSILAVLGMSLPAMADDAAAPAASSAPAKKGHKHAMHHGKHTKKKAAAPADSAPAK